MAVAGVRICTVKCKCNYANGYSGVHSSTPNGKWCQERQEVLPIPTEYSTDCGRDSAYYEDIHWDTHANSACEVKARPLWGEQGRDADLI